MSEGGRELCGLNVCRYDYLPGWRLTSHEHSGYFQVFYIYDGRGTAWIGNEPYTVKPGAVLLIMPGVAHGLRSDQGEKLRTLDAKFRISSERLRELCRKIPPIQHLNDEDIYGLLEAVRREAVERAPFFRDVCQMKLQELVLRLARSHTDSRIEAKTIPAEQTMIPEPRENSRVAKGLLLYLKNHYSEPMTTESLARGMLYSYRYLSDVCSSAYRMSPMRLLMYVRVEKATKLIRQDLKPLKEVADLCGFSNVHHFSRTFTQIVGRPPGKWREELSGQSNIQYAIDPEFEDRDRTRH